MYQRTFSCVLLFWALAQVASAQEVRGPRMFYKPGFAAADLPLRVFGSLDLASTCEALERNDLDTTRQKFKKAIEEDNDNLVAHIGYLQTASAELKELMLPAYKRDVVNKATVANHFKLGLLATYLYIDVAYPWTQAGEKRGKPLVEIAWKEMEAAYRASHSPLVGLTLTMTYSACRRPPELKHIDGRWTEIEYKAINVYDDLLHRLAGDENYATYARAKRNKWIGPQPKVPKLSMPDLRVLRWIVGEMYASNTGRGGKTVSRVVNGKLVWSIEWQPIPEERTRGAAYLKEWYTSIKAETNRS